MNYIVDEKPIYNPDTQLCMPRYELTETAFYTHWDLCDIDAPSEPLPAGDPDEPTLRERVDALESAVLSMIMGV